MSNKNKKINFFSNPGNANQGTARGGDMLENTVRRVGAGRSGVAAKDGTVIAGNHALQAMEDLDIPIREIHTDGSEWIVVVRDDLDSATDPKAVELAIADNRVNEVNYRPDINKIIEASQQQPLDTLYTSEEIQELIQNAADTSVAESQKGDGNGESSSSKPKNYLDLTPRAKLGEVWQCGAQKIICGDALDLKVWEKLFQENKCNLCVTSPPYAKQRSYDKESGFEPVAHNQYKQWFEPIQSHLDQFLTSDGSYFLNLKANIENHQRTLYDKELLLAHVHEWGWLFRDEFAWVHNGTPARVWYTFKNQWEPIYHFTKVERIKIRPDAVAMFSENVPAGGGPAVSQIQGSGDGLGVGVESTDGMAYPGNVLNIGKNQDAWGFPAAFPCKLPAFFIKGYSDPSDIVFDPFCGSGTTLVAAQQEERRGLAIEISPKALEVTLLRLEELAGTKAYKIC